jgi:hypothetical protein
MPRNRSAWAVVLLAAVFFVESLYCGLSKSSTGDEPYHIPAALSYVSTGRIVVNQQHPPLLKEISGLFLLAGGVRWPSNPDTEALMLGAEDRAVSVGNAIMIGQGRDRVLFWARLPFILLSTLFVFVLYGFGRALLGEGAALGAAFLYVFDPTITAHSYPVTTDSGVAFFIVLFLWALWSYLQHPGPARLMVSGVALGAALCCKFSAVALLPVSAILMAAAAGFRPKLKSYGLALAGMCILTLAVVECIYLFPKDPLRYVDGMRLVNADHKPDYKYMMGGQYDYRFYSYFIVAWFLKEPLAGIIATLTGLAIALRAGAMPRLVRGFLFVPAAALFAGYTLYADDMGIRYIIPVLPFTFLLGGLALATLLQSTRKWQRAAGAALCVWLVAAAAGIYPDGLSYFNEMACLLDDPAKIGLDGGSRCGTSWLDQSNVDWGQSLKQLRAWLDKNAAGKRVYYGNSVAVSFPPEAYGIQTRPTDYADVMSGTKPGIYAVSAQLVARAQNVPGGGWWLRQTQPMAIVGHAIYIFDVPAVTY